MKSRIRQAERSSGVSDGRCPHCVPGDVLAEEFFDERGERYLLVMPGYGDDPALPRRILPENAAPACPSCGGRGLLIVLGCTQRVRRPRDAGPDWEIDWEQVAREPIDYGSVVGTLITRMPR